MVWWVVVPIVGIVAKVVYEAVTSDDPSPPSKPDPHKVLKQNLVRLGSELKQQPGYRLAVLGQPGSGKSSLICNLSYNEAQPLPVIGAQTDATDWSKDSCVSLASSWRGVTLVDVPGYDTQTHPSEVFVDHFPFDAVDEVWLVYSGKLHAADEKLWKAVSNQVKYVLAVRTFSDGLHSEDRSNWESDFRSKIKQAQLGAVRKFPAEKRDSPNRGRKTDVLVQFVSNRTQEGIEVLRDAFLRISGAV